MDGKIKGNDINGIQMKAQKWLQSLNTMEKVLWNYYHLCTADG